MAKIKVMDELLANKIAAGEVVERCASVVKELVENSIDAGSSEIKIDLREVGTSSIKVIDNGIGMDKEDSILAFHRHATSKLKKEEELFHIETLGFRGEALASIASVSQVTLKTSSGKEGTLVKIAGGKLLSVEVSEARKGTSIEIENLFYNTPARLKHMKSFYTELSSITEYVNKIALSHPEIQFTLTNNGSVLLNTDGSNHLHKVIKEVFGLEVARKMVFIEGEKEDYKVSGYMSLPEIHKSSRNGIVTLVNGRVVRNQELNHSINESYHSYKPDNRYPVVVLNIVVDASLIDVNIHPTKMDIKFSKMDSLIELVKNLIEEKLHQMNHTPKIEAHAIQKEKIEQLDFDFVEEEKIENKEKNPSFSLQIEEKEIPYSKETNAFSIDEELVDQKEKKKWKTLEPIGIVHATYIVCQNEEGMTLIDQHAAKERCNYELFKKKLGNPTSHTIRPFLPFTFEFPTNEFIILKQHFDLLQNIGFEIEEFGLASVVVKAHPTWLPSGATKEAVYHILEAIISFEKDFTVEKFNEKVATMLSCKLAIKANDYITLEEAKHLLEDLSHCENPFHCPHGRPTMIAFDKTELEKLFKRSGF